MPKYCVGEPSLMLALFTAQQTALRIARDQVKAAVAAAATEADETVEAVSARAVSVVQAALESDALQRFVDQLGTGALLPTMQELVALKEPPVPGGVTHVLKDELFATRLARSLMPTLAVDMAAVAVQCGPGGAAHVHHTASHPPAASRPLWHADSTPVEWARCGFPWDSKRRNSVMVGRPRGAKGAKAR
jgi:hypothetical protein